MLRHPGSLLNQWLIFQGCEALPLPDLALPLLKPQSPTYPLIQHLQYLPFLVTPRPQLCFLELGLLLLVPPQSLPSLQRYHTPPAAHRHYSQLWKRKLQGLLQLLPEDYNYLQHPKPAYQLRNSNPLSLPRLPYEKLL